MAVAIQAFKMVNLTDVDGVMDTGRKTVFRQIRIAEIEALIENGTISGGMIPKIRSSVDAVKRGVDYAHIINGNKGHNLLLELFTRDGVGTMIFGEER